MYESKNTALCFFEKDSPGVSTCMSGHSALDLQEEEVLHEHSNGIHTRIRATLHQAGVWKIRITSLPFSMVTDKIK
jgi:hypothetical protein